jgi:hypothetical protein
MLQALIAPMDQSCLLWLTQDVSDLQAQQQELERAVKTRTKDLQEALEVKGRFLAMVSHEIRTPLAVLASLSMHPAHVFFASPGYSWQHGVASADGASGVSAPAAGYSAVMWGAAFQRYQRYFAAVTFAGITTCVSSLE